MNATIKQNKSDHKNAAESIVVGEEEKILFDTQGFFILKDVLSNHEINLIKGVFSELENNDYEDKWKISEKGMGTKSKSGNALRLNGWPRLTEELDFLIAHPRIQIYLDEFMHKPYLVNTWYINKSQGKGDIGWHSGLPSSGHYNYRGKSYSNMINTIWALDENNIKTGCPIVLPGSHKRVFDYSNNYQGLAMPGSIPVNLNPGDVLLFSEATLHGGLAMMSEGQRRNIYINHIDHKQMLPLDDGNLHHYSLPESVRNRFPGNKQRLFEWMKTIKAEE
jgi:hypothetical protein